MIKTPFSTWDPQWSPTEQEVFRDFGFAAFTAQMLDLGICFWREGFEAALGPEQHADEFRDPLRSEVPGLGSLMVPFWTSGSERYLALPLIQRERHELQVEEGVVEFGAHASRNDVIPGDDPPA
jgi:hypothetical protein